MAKLRNPRTAEAILKMLAAGATDVIAAKHVGVTSKTLQRHRVHHKAFARAYIRAKAVGVHVRNGDPVPDAAVSELAVEFEERGYLDDCDPDPDEVVEPEVVIPEVLHADPHPPPPVHIWPPLGSVAGATSGLDDHPTVVKATKIVDNPDAPVALRVAAWKTLHEATLGPAIEQVMLSLKVRAMERAQAATAETAPAEQGPSSGRGVSRDATADLMDAIAGPVPEE